MGAEMYEVFEHTADVGLHITAPSLEDLLVEAARGLFSLIIDEPAEVRPAQRIEIHVPGAEAGPASIPRSDPLPGAGPDPLPGAAAYLLFDWLSELLYIFETKRLVLADFRVHINDDDRSLIAEAWGEAIDESRHRLDHEVKAITYHGLEVSQTPSGWEARVIVDI